MIIPEFVSATVLILVFSGCWLVWLPGMVLTAHFVRTVRASMLEVLEGDYVRRATLKGNHGHD
jgi:ABC-type dipeptide/oligopeptide/nickel transport system permease component